MTTFDKIAAITADQLGIDTKEVTRESNFAKDFQADSLDMIELVMEIEDEFDINIPESEAQGIETVGQAVDRVERELAAT